MLPILLALLLIIPLSVYSSRVALGRRTYLARFFRIPEETQPPNELQATRRYTTAQRDADELPNFADAVKNPVVNALACAMGTARHRHAPANQAQRQRIIDEAMAKGLEALTPLQRMRLLDDPVALARLHARLWHVDGDTQDHGPVIGPRRSPRWRGAARERRKHALNAASVQLK